MSNEMSERISNQAKTIEGMTQLVSRASQLFEKGSDTELTDDIRQGVFLTLRYCLDYLDQIPRNQTNVMLEVVGYEETRQIEAVREKGSDQVKYLAPVSGTSKAFIDVRTPRNQCFRIPIEDSILEAIYYSNKERPSVKDFLETESEVK